MAELATLLDEVCSYCDVMDRLKRLPPGALVRGLSLRAMERTLAQADKLAAYRAFYPDRYASIQWLPAEDFLVRLVVGGALLRGAAEVHEGMYEIGRRNASTFGASALGKVLLRVLSRDPQRLLMQGQLGRRHLIRCGSWVLTFPGEREACVQMSNEYFYIESYLLGAAYGTFEAVRVSAQVEVELDAPFAGRHLIRW